MVQIGPYQVLEKLAQGGMGVVYRAFDPSLKREVALKLLLGSRDADDRQRRRFQREAEALARLRHPHLVCLHHAGEHEGLAYLVLELVRGETLGSRLGGGPLAPRAAAELVLGLARGLDAACAQGILHRDVKPENVLLGEDGRVLLTDFGLAYLEDHASRLTQSGVFVGTPGFCSPEQALGQLESLGPPTDVYGLGATLYCCLTGEPPSNGDGPLEVVVATVSTPPRPPGELCPGLDADLEAVCLRCLEKRPAQRYADPGELAADLERWLAGEPVQARRPSRRRRAGWGLGAAALLVLLGVWGVRARGRAQVADRPRPSARPTVGAQPTASQSPRSGPEAPRWGALELESDGWTEAAWLDARRALSWSWGPAPGERQVRLWDLSRPEAPTCSRSWSLPGPVNGVVWSGTTAVATGPSWLARWQLDASAPPQVDPTWLNGGPHRLLLTRDGARVVLITNQAQGKSPACELAVFNVADLSQVGDVVAEDDQVVRGAALLPDGRLLAAAGGRNPSGELLPSARLSTWTLQPLAEVEKTSTQHPLLNLVLDPGGRTAWTGDTAGRIVRWRRDARWEPAAVLVGKDVLAVPGQMDLGMPCSHSEQVTDLALDAAGGWLYSVGGRGVSSARHNELRVWRVADDAPVAAVTDFPQPPDRVHLSPDGQWLLVGLAGGVSRVELWETAALRALGVARYADVPRRGDGPAGPSRPPR